MKYLNMVLTVIALCLCGIVFALFQLRAALLSGTEQTERVVISNQAVIESAQRLDAGLAELRKQIASIGDQLTRK